MEQIIIYISYIGLAVILAKADILFWRDWEYWGITLLVILIQSVEFFKRLQTTNNVKMAGRIKWEDKS